LTTISEQKNINFQWVNKSLCEHLFENRILKNLFLVNPKYGLTKVPWKCEVPNYHSFACTYVDYESGLLILLFLQILKYLGFNVYLLYRYLKYFVLRYSGPEFVHKLGSRCLCINIFTRWLNILSEDRVEIPIS